jgi:hypothetical protein
MRPVGLRAVSAAGYHGGQHDDEQPEAADLLKTPHVHLSAGIGWT